MHVIYVSLILQISEGQLVLYVCSHDSFELHKKNESSHSLDYMLIQETSSEVTRWETQTKKTTIQQFEKTLQIRL